MNDSKQNNEFINALLTLRNSNEKFFEVVIPYNKDLKIFLDPSGLEWILRYKHKMIKRALKLKKILNSKVSDEAFIFLFYFYEFVMPDIFMLHNLLPKKILNTLDIGAGIGLFEIYLNHLYGKQNKVDIIEVNNLVELDHHNKNIKPEKLKNPLHVLDLTKKFLQKNNILNINLIDSKKILKKSSTPYDIVISFRAWGFLFELDEYIEYVTKNLVKNGIVIADINKRTNCKNIFEREFNNVKIVHSYQAHDRLIGTKKD